MVCFPSEISDLTIDFTKLTETCSNILSLLDCQGIFTVEYISEVLDDIFAGLDSSKESERKTVSNITGCVLSGLLNTEKINLNQALDIACTVYINTDLASLPNAFNIGAYAAEVFAQISQSNDNCLMTANLIVKIKNKQNVEKNSNSFEGSKNLGIATAGIISVTEGSLQEFTDCLSALLSLGTQN